MRKIFGTTQDGEQVEKITIAAGNITVSVLTFGAILQDVRLVGVDHGLTLGSPDLAAYEGPFYSFGSVCGPVANRIANACATLNGRDYRFQANAPGGHTLHSGDSGLHRKVWQIEDLSTRHVTLSAVSAHGEGGFPGKRRWEARFDVSAPAVLSLTLTARTDAPTWVNPVNHSYWNLDGGESFDGHQLQIFADHYLPLSEELIPTGEIAQVSGTEMDFRVPRVLEPADIIDNNFCLTRARGPLRPAVRLKGQHGIEMLLETTDPGIQVYDGKGIEGSGLRGHDLQTYGPRAGLALEAQFWPNALNEPRFPSTQLDPGEHWTQQTRFSFSGF